MRDYGKLILFLIKAVCEVILEKLKNKKNKKYLSVCMIGFTLGLLGCMPQSNMHLPDVCLTDNGTRCEDSLILEHINNPYNASIVLEIANLEMLSRMELYNVKDAHLFFDDIERKLEHFTTWKDLFDYVAFQLAALNDRAQMELMYITSYFHVLNEPIPLSECDIALVRAHIERQRRLLNRYN